MVTLNWVTRYNSGGDIELQRVDLDKVSSAGVYMIWHGGAKAHVVRVGQGVISDRLKDHRKDQYILEYSSKGLFAVWAQVDMPSRDGIERYLSEKWKPLVGSRFPNVPPIVVNSPWKIAA
ncbi:hypothetical protein [Roseobacter sp. A03A-229]